MSGFRKATSIVGEWASGQAAGAAGTYLDELAEGLKQYSGEAIARSEAAGKKGVAASGIVQKLGLVPTSTLVLVGIAALVAVVVLTK